MPAGAWAGPGDDCDAAIAPVVTGRVDHDLLNQLAGRLASHWAEYQPGRAPCDGGLAGCGGPHGSSEPPGSGTPASPGDLPGSGGTCGSGDTAEATATIRRRGHGGCSGTWPPPAS